MSVCYKRIIVITLLFHAVTAIAFCQQKETTPDLSSLRNWQAGVTVSEGAVAAFGGTDACFSSKPIPDAIWKRMQGKTYQENPHIRRTDLRYLRVLHWDYDEKIHLGEMVCNKIIADRLVTIFRNLYEAKYPIQRMVLPDEYDADDEKQMRANNTSCFCYRLVAGSAKLSKHSKGLAVDINPLYNPYYKKRGRKVLIQPSNALRYCNRNIKFPYKINKQDLCYRLFIENGFLWGGAWKTMKDYQHFELKDN